MPTQRTESYVSVVILLAAAALVAFIFLPELNAIVLGVSLAVLFQPWYAALKRFLRDRSGAAAAVIVILIVALFLLLATFIGLQLFFEAQALYSQISSRGTVPVGDGVRAAVHALLPSLNIDITPYVQQVLGMVVGSVGPIFSGVFAGIGTIFLSFFALYYFLKDGGKFRTVIVERGPLPAERAEQILSRLYARTGSVIRGSLLMAALYGVLTGVGFALFGLPNGILWGAVTAIASFIPAIGVLLIVIPGIIVLYLSGSIAGAAGLLAWLFAMSTVMEMYVRLRLIGGTEKIHPMLMLFAVLGGLSFFGAIGILLGPLALGLLLTLLETYPFFDLESLNRK